MGHYGDRYGYGGYGTDSAYRNGYDDASRGRPDQNRYGGGYDGYNGNSPRDSAYADGRKDAGDRRATPYTEGNAYGGSGGWRDRYAYSPWSPRGPWG